MRKHQDVTGKLLRVVGIFLLLLFTMVGSVVAENQYVLDDVGIFSSEDRQEMNESAKILEEMTATKVMIFVKKTFGVAGAQKYNEKMYRQYRLKGNDITIALATEDREIDVYSAEEAVVSVADQGLDSIMPYLSNGEYGKGLKELQKIMLEYFEENTNKEQTEVAQISTISSVNDITQNSVTSREEKGNVSYVLLIAIILFVTVGFLIISFVMSTVYGKRIKKQQEINLELKEKMENTRKEVKAEYSRQLQEKGNQVFRLQKEYETKLQALEQKLQSTHQLLEESNRQLQNCNRKYEMIAILHPAIEEEIKEYLRKKQEEEDKAVAQSYDEAYQKLMQEATSRSLCEPLRELTRKYENLTEAQHGWVVSDFEKLTQKLAEAQAMQRQYEEEQEEKRCRKLAEDYTREAEKFISETQFGVTLRHRETARRLQEEYQNLPRMSQNFLKVTTLQSLKVILATTEALYRRQQEEERRRAEERRREEERRRAEERRREEERRRAEERRRKEEEEERERKRRRDEEQARLNRMHSSSSSSSFRSSSSSNSGTHSTRSFGSSGSFGGGSSRGGGAGRKF